MKHPNYSYSDFINKLYNKKTTFITFQVTENCNLNCSYCYQKNKTSNKMNFETAKKYIDLLLSPTSEVEKGLIIKNNESVACVIDFIGGEPFLEIELISRIADYFISQAILLNHPWQYNYCFSITSNGTLYFDTRVQDFLKKHQSHVGLTITIDGNKELHDSCRKFPSGEGSYDIAIKAAEHWKKQKKINLGTKITLAPENIKYTSEAIINMINLGYSDIYSNCVYEVKWNLNQAKTFYQELIKIANYILFNNLEDSIYFSLFGENIGTYSSNNANWCGGAGHNLMTSINHTGNIYPCLRYMESSLGEIPPAIIGNVNIGVGKEPNHLATLNKLLNITKKTQSNSECINCPIAEGCGWCSAWNYQENNGEFNKRSTNICLMHQARVLANSYYWNFYYWKHLIPKNIQINLPDEQALKIISEQELKKLKILSKYKLIIDRGE